MVRSLEKTARRALEMDGAKGVTKQIPISAADGTPLVSFRVFTIAPGGHTPYHAHDFEHLNFIIEGQGRIMQDNGSHASIGKGDFALVLPGERHQYVNTGETPLVIICAVPKEHE